MTKPVATDPDLLRKSPNLLRKGWNFAKAYYLWKAAGKPVRSPERIADLYAICEQCPIFQGGICTHEACGCPVRQEAVWRNKLTWATESCPLDPPKWHADVNEGGIVKSEG